MKLKLSTLSFAAGSIIGMISLASEAAPSRPHGDPSKIGPVKNGASAQPAEAPSILLSASGVLAGGTVETNPLLPVIINATSRSYSGIIQIEILSGSKIVLSKSRKIPAKVMTLSGELFFRKNTLLTARSRDSEGKQTFSKSISIKVNKVEDWNQDALNTLEVHPASAIVYPGNSFKARFCLSAKSHLSGTFYLRPDNGFRADPQEVPVSLNKGDTVLFHSKLIPPAKREFNGKFQVQVFLDNVEIANGFFLFCPWKPNLLIPEGSFTIRRRSKRTGFCIDKTVLRLSKQVDSAGGCRLECYSGGWPDTNVELEVGRPPPWRPLKFTRMLSKKLAWHKIIFDLKGIPLAKETTFTIQSNSRGKVLLGKALIIEKQKTK